MKASGIVIRVLADDLKGSRHQKFVVRIKSGKEILIVHNIDIAPRINGLKKGDKIEFLGDYQWNSQGGMVHWTHADPHQQHQSGWIKYHGETYQ